MFGEAAKASQFADLLLKKGIYVIPFSYPVVPQGEARIRIQVSAVHTKKDLAFTVEKFAEVRRENNS
jgi:glycine C-acetyltransferase